MNEPFFIRVESYSVLKHPSKDDVLVAVGLDGGKIVHMVFDRRQALEMSGTLESAARTPYGEQQRIHRSPAVAIPHEGHEAQSTAGTKPSNATPDGGHP
jgi:hypothetical protein